MRLAMPHSLLNEFKIPDNEIYGALRAFFMIKSNLGPFQSLESNLSIFKACANPEYCVHAVSPSPNSRTFQGQCHMDNFGQSEYDNTNQ